MIRNIDKIIRIFIEILTFVLFFVALFFLLFLDFQSIKSGVSENSSDTIYIINGYTAIFGGTNIEILNGYFSGGEFYAVLPSTFVTEIRFDYITFIGILVCFISLFFMVLSFNKKISLLISLVFNVASLVVIWLEVYSFCFINQGIKSLAEAFQLSSNYLIFNLGAITFVCIIGFIDLIYLIRFLILLFKKVTID